jgi:hypothetical protein
MRTTASWLPIILASTIACAKEPQQSGTDSTAVPVAATRAATPAKDGNACHLLTQQEVHAIVEEPIDMAVVDELEPAYSVCHWESKGLAVFKLLVYWRGGKQQWEIEKVARGMADQIFRKDEGVVLDSIVKQGYVTGIGDAAYFSEILPSLILKGDVLVEITNPLAPKPAAKFRAMATTLLSRL